MTLRAEVRVTAGELDLRASISASATDSVAVLGPNGSGKTTLLRALAGLVRLRSGRVELDGNVLEDADAGVWVPPERRGVAMVFQEPFLFPHLSVLDNVAFGLRCRGVDRPAARRRALAWLERVGLTRAGDHRVGQLSGGQAQRVALARALATEPRLLLLDEPLASVDAGSSVALRQVLAEQVRDLPGVRVLVTHDPVDAAALAETVVVLEAGRVVQVGSYAEIAARPRSPWAARLAGAT